MRAPGIPLPGRDIKSRPGTRATARSPDTAAAAVLRGAAQSSTEFGPAGDAGVLAAARYLPDSTRAWSKPRLVVVRADSTAA
jgi:hypothetical protein